MLMPVMFDILLPTNALIGPMKEASGLQKSSLVPPTFSYGSQDASKSLVGAIGNVF